MTRDTEPAYCPCCYAPLRDLFTQKHIKEGLTDCEARILIDELRKQVGVCQKSIKRLTAERDELLAKQVTPHDL